MGLRHVRLGERVACPTTRHALSCSGPHGAGSRNRCVIRSRRSTVTPGLPHHLPHACSLALMTCVGLLEEKEIIGPKPMAVPKSSIPSAVI